jgi:two-component system OmpR family sensor kinase
LGSHPGDLAIVAAVVRLAHAMGLEVIAEGVETEEQRAHLAQLGCDRGQGFLWSRPVPAAAVATLVGRLLAPGSAPPPAPRRDAAQDELDELLATLTHELATPLTVIGGYAEMLHDRLEKAEAATLIPGIAAIERNVHNLARLVEALAEARDGGGPGTDQTTFDVAAFANQVVGDLEPLIAQRRVVVAAGDEPVVVTGNQIRLRQVLTNLISNAVKFTEPGTAIDVFVTPGAHVAEVAVVDHGPGVPDDRVGELFGRFARLGSKRKGLGLGLYLSRSLMRRHGGDLRHEPTPGGGATFVATLPLAPPDTEP